MTRKIEMLVDLSSTSQLSSAHEPIRCTHHKLYYIWIIMISSKHLMSTLFDSTLSFLFSTFLGVSQRRLWSLDTCLLWVSRLSYGRWCFQPLRCVFFPRWISPPTGWGEIPSTVWVQICLLSTCSYQIEGFGCHRTPRCDLLREFDGEWNPLTKI